MINQSIFKSYDIRGVYPDQLNENTAYQVGKVFAKYTGAKKVAVGFDARISSPALFKALSEGIISRGADLYNIGQAPTECLYFAVGNYDFDAGVMITASHNPKEYNGFKMIKKTEGAIEMVSGKDLFSAIEDNNFEEKIHGKIHKKDIWQDYLNYILKFSGNIKPFKIVIDASNGVVGRIIGKIKDKLPVKIIELNFEPDGNFPNHSPNPLEKGSSDQIASLIKKEKANFGFMFDGDADRILLVDENGQLVLADIALLLLVEHFLEKNPGGAIAYNLICSKAVPEFIKKWGGMPIRTPVGFVNVRDGLIKNNGIMGGESSAHYCFKDYFYMDSGMLAFLTLLQIISKKNKSVLELVKEFSVYAKADINFEVNNKEEISEKIKEKYINGKQDFLDGVTVEYKDWWFNVRPSNTEPLLRLTIEAETQELLDEKKQELSNFILR